MRKNSPQPLFDRRCPEKGAALITSIFVLLLITVLGMALTFVANTSLIVSNNDRQSAQAFYIAQAGASHAKAIFEKTSASNYNGILAAGNAASNSGDELSVQPAGYSGPAFVAIPQAGVAFGAGNYKVYVKDDINAPPSTSDTNGKVIVTAVGTGADGSTASVEMILTTTFMPGLLANGKATIYGNINIDGAGGAMHANGAAVVTGNVCATKYINSSTTVTVSGFLNCGTVSGGQPIVNPPVYNLPTDFLPLATYVLGSDGRVYNGAGYAGHINPLASGWGGWTWNGTKKLWTSPSFGAIPAGTYYGEGSNIYLFGNGAPNVTLIAEGFIETFGNFSISPYLPGYTLVSGNDIYLTGNGGNPSNPGLIYAASQIKLYGNLTYYGPLVAANLNDNNAPGTNSPANRLTYAANGALYVEGNITLTHNGSSSGSNASLSSWREVRN